MQTASAAAATTDSDGGCTTGSVASDANRLTDIVDDLDDDDDDDDDDGREVKAEGEGRVGLVKATAPGEEQVDNSVANRVDRNLKGAVDQWIHFMDVRRGAALDPAVISELSMW